MGREARQSVKTQDGFSIKVEITQRNMAAGGAYLGKDYGCDCLYYRNLRLESGRIYGLISEYGQGCMYLSWLLGGKAATDELLISLNDQKMSRRDLQKISWNLEPSRERYRNAVVIKAIQNAIWKNGLSDSFSDIQNRFFLSSPRQDRKLLHLSGERWRASAALGFAEGKKIFYAPYKTSGFYYAMCQSGLLKALKELAASGGLVLLPCGSDSFLKHIVDECVYLDQAQACYMEELRSRYQEILGHGDWIRDVETRENSRVMQAIRDRRSVRRYAAEKVPRETVEAVLRAGMRAPSAKNRQPWRFIVTTGKAKAQVLDVMEKGLEREKASPFLPESAQHLQGAWHSLGIMRQAPVLIFVINVLGVEMGRSLTADQRVSEICNAQSIGAALENMSLAAEEQGLGSLWICNTFFAQKELDDWLGGEGELYAAMALGYAEGNFLAGTRKKMQDVVEWRE